MEENLENKKKDSLSVTKSYKCKTFLQLKRVVLNILVFDWEKFTV